MAAQGPESNARLMLNVLDLMLDLMLSNVSYPPQAAQEVIHNASLLPHGWSHHVNATNE